MQIRPNAPLPIVYVISDPSDTGTYYVRSVLRNSATGAIIKNNGLNYINLVVDAGNSRRFSKLIQAPQDSSGAGFYIDVTTTVYTDAGYTNVATNYQEDNTKYLVLEPWTVALGSGGGRGGFVESKSEASAIDYKKLKEVLLEAFSELPTTELPEPVDISPAIEHLVDIKQSLDTLPRAAEMKDFFDGYADNITTTHQKSIDNIKFPEQKELDISPLVDAVKGIEYPETISPSQHKQAMKQILDTLNSVKESLPHTKYIEIMQHFADAFTSGSKPKKTEDDPFTSRAKRLLA